MLHFLNLRYRWILLLVLALTFFTRIYHLDQPKTYVFDEVYHAVTAKLIARNDVRAYEWWNEPVEPNTAVDWLHPPLAKYTQAVGILIYGENAFGWRISSVLFGVLVVMATFKLADLLFASKPVALVAAVLSSLDGLLLVQSRTAMNDIHVTFAILLTLIVYLMYRRNHQPWWLLLTGLVGGAAMATKWSGVFAVGIVGLVEGLLSLRDWYLTYIQGKSLVAIKVLIKKLLWMLIALVVVPAVVYIASYSHMFLQGKTMSHFQELHRQIWWYQTNLTATHEYQSRPWQWFFNLRPVWFHIDYTSNDQVANIYAQGNPALFWLGGLTVIATGLSIIIAAIGRRKIVWPLVFLLAAYLVVWLPWELSPRIMFFYHYTPAVPLMCILLAYWLQQSWRAKLYPAVYLILGIILTTFIIWYPLWTNIPLPSSLVNKVYFAVPSWK